MASSTINTNNVVTNFHAKVRKEYVRGGRYEAVTGNNENSVIQVNNDLKKFSIPLVAKLSGAGVRGSSQLTGSEEALSNYAATFQPKHVRQGVLIDNEEREKSEFDLFSEAKPALMDWMMELKRDQITQALMAVEAGGTYYNYGGAEDTGATGSSAASATNMDTWVTNNSDRILYGAVKSNLSAGDHTTSLATIDTTNDKLDTDMITLMKRMAADADPLIKPIKISADSEPFYILFVGKYGFRDLRENATMLQANREARSRGETNPLFVGGDLMWDNVIIKEVRSMDKFIDATSSADPFNGLWGVNATGDDLRTAGNSSSRVGVAFLCGAQAVTFGIGKVAKFKTRKEDDYGHLAGVGIEAKHDIKKNFYNNKQHGVLTCFHSASLDS
jgi:N4-gp56 family major capsid protein